MTLRKMLAHPLNGYSALIVLLVTLSLVAAGLTVGFRMNRNTERKFCDMAQSNVTVYEETPPTTKTGQSVAENWKALRDRLHCPAD